LSEVAPHNVLSLLGAWFTRYGPLAGEQGPELFVREVLGVEPDEWQIEVLRAFGRRERFIAIRSCHGVGKTTVASWLVVIMLCTRYPQKTAITAPTKGQLEDALLAELSSWLAKLPAPVQKLIDVTKNRVELVPARAQSFVSAKTARDENPEALQGVHSENVLLIADEASGVSEKVFEAAVGSMSGHNATTLLLGNPVRTSGTFFNAFHAQSDMWFTMHVTGVPGTAGRYSPRVSAEYVEQVRRQYGEDSNQFRVRALGEFPKADDFTIIPFELIESAQRRKIETRPDMSVVWGVDVARFGSDRNVLVSRNKLALHSRILTWQGRDLMKTAGIVKREWDETPVQRRPETILVDVIGMGAGVVDRLRELKLPARGINVSETTGIDPRYKNLRTELWFRGREWLAGRDRSLPARCSCGRCTSDKDHAVLLAQELAAQRYDYGNSEGVVFATPKKAMRKVLGRSPDIADAFLLTFAAEPATLINGRVGGRRRTDPLRRKRTIV
jgi:phage terminase large subunit